MATTSKVKADLDDIAAIIRSQRELAATCAATVQSAINSLAAMPATYTDTIATVNAYTPTGAFEESSQDELTKLTAEFTALDASLDTALAALSAAS